jgi:hypothetical protein
LETIASNFSSAAAFLAQTASVVPNVGADKDDARHAARQSSFSDDEKNEVCAKLASLSFGNLLAKIDVADRFCAFAVAKAKLLDASREEWAAFDKPMANLVKKCAETLGDLDIWQGSHAMKINDICSGHHLFPENIEFAQLLQSAKSWTHGMQNVVRDSVDARANLLIRDLTDMLPGRALLQNKAILTSPELQEGVINSPRRKDIPDAVMKAATYNQWIAGIMTVDLMNQLKEMIAHGKLAIGVDFGIRKVLSVKDMDPEARAAACTVALDKVKTKGACGYKEISLEHVIF